MLSRFKSEILENGATACLPANLSDEWLEWLEKELSFLDEDGPVTKEDDIVPPSCAIAALATILLAKQGGEEVQLTTEELLRMLECYRLEIGIETVHRKTEMKFSRATLDTIFTNRELTAWRET